MKNSRKYLAIAIGVLLGVGISAGIAHAVDDDQAAWTNRYMNDCTLSSGYINYVRVPIPNTCRRNFTTQRDGELRDSSSKYLDDYFIGNLYGGSPNTDRVWNLMSINVVAWTGTCYSGAPTTIASGAYWSPGVYANLRSLARSGISACGQP